MTAAPSVSLVPEPDIADVLDRHQVLRAAHQKHAHDAWVGALVVNFTNDELRVLADIMSVGETMDLRRLGLLADDEGYDGTKESRQRCEANTRQWHGKIQARAAAAAGGTQNG